MMMFLPSMIPVLLVSLSLLSLLLAKSCCVSGFVGVVTPSSRTQLQQQQQQQQPTTTTTTRTTTTTLYLSKKKKMKRPILDQIATTLFKLENKRVEMSSETDDDGRYGEPMEWSEADSTANKFSQFVASNPVGYAFKQWVADIVAGNDYDKQAVQTQINNFIASDDIVMFSFTTCPFCRRAKDVLDEKGVSYSVMELDELPLSTDDSSSDDDDIIDGNIIRAELGRKVKRTSVPSIFIKGKFIGGCNDGNPGLIPYIESGEFDKQIMTQ